MSFLLQETELEVEENQLKIKRKILPTERFFFLKTRVILKS